MPLGSEVESLKGSLDASNLESFSTAARGAFEKGSGISSSTGFSSFLMVGDLAAPGGGGRIVFVATPVPIKAIFKVLGLEDALAFAADAPAALAFLAAASVDSQEATG